MGQSPAIISESSGDKESSLCIHAGYYFVGGFSEGSKGVPQGEVLWYHSAGRIHRGVRKKGNQGERCTSHPASRMAVKTLGNMNGGGQDKRLDSRHDSKEHQGILH